jgi:hypothetical protein
MKKEQLYSIFSRLSTRETLALLTTGVTVGVLLPALLYLASTNATAQEISIPPTPTGTPQAPLIAEARVDDFLVLQTHFPEVTGTLQPEVLASSPEEGSISGGIPWPNDWPEIMGKVLVDAYDLNDVNYALTSSGAVVNLENGLQGLLTCQHCLTDDEDFYLHSAVLENKAGTQATVTDIVRDHTAPIYKVDGRQAAALSDPSVLAHSELDFSVLPKLRAGQSVRVILVAYDYEQHRVEYARGRLHRNNGDNGCIFNPNTATDHACFTADELQTSIPGNSGGILILEDVFDREKVSRIVAGVRSQYLQMVVNEAWFKGITSLNCDTLNQHPNATYQCLRYPVGLPTLTPTPPNGTEPESFPTATNTMTPRPGTTATPRATATATYTRMPGGPTRTPTSRPTPTVQMYGERLYLPLVANQDGTIIIPVAAGQ